jgi:hypothetical protein
MPTEGAVGGTAVGGTAVGGISEAPLGVDFLVLAEDPAVEDTVNLHHSAVREAIAAEDTGAVIVGEDTGVFIAGETVEAMAMLVDILTEDTTIVEDITEVTIGTITEDTLHMERPLGSFSVEWLLGACTVHSGGLITLSRYLQPTMTRTINFPMVLLRT